MSPPPTVHGLSFPAMIQIRALTITADSAENLWDTDQLLEFLTLVRTYTSCLESST